jgi:hypothetical protein
MGFPIHHLKELGPPCPDGPIIDRCSELVARDPEALHPAPLAKTKPRKVWPPTFWPATCQDLSRRLDACAGLEDEAVVRVNLEGKRTTQNRKPTKSKPKKGKTKIKHRPSLGMGKKGWHHAVYKLAVRGTRENMYKNISPSPHTLPWQFLMKVSNGLTSLDPPVKLYKIKYPASKHDVLWRGGQIRCRHRPLGHTKLPLHGPPDPGEPRCVSPPSN